MSVFFFILGFVSFIFFIIGLFSPKTSLFWVSDVAKRKRGLSVAVYLSVWIISLILGNVLSPKGETVNNVNDTEVVVSEVEETVAPPKKEEPKNWKYSETVDEMTDLTNYFAECVSVNTHDFKFPYKKNTPMYIYVRNMNGKNDLYLYIDAQVMTSLFGDEYIRIKFDDGELMTVPYNSSTDGSSKYAFPQRSTTLINKIKNAKKVKIDIPMYNEGRCVFDFNVEGLVWEH